MSLPNVINEINTIKSTYLPLSGGIMIGSIQSATNIGRPSIRYGNPTNATEKGGELWLFSSQHENYKGGALIRCTQSDNSAVTDFWFKSDGYMYARNIQCGEITSTNSSAIARNVNNESLYICAAPDYSEGALLRL